MEEKQVKESSSEQPVTDRGEDIVTEVKKGDGFIKERRQNILVFDNVEVTPDFHKSGFSGMMGMKPNCTDELMGKAEGLV